MSYEPDGIYHRQMAVLAEALQEEKMEVAVGIIQAMQATFEEDDEISPTIKQMNAHLDNGDILPVMKTVIDLVWKMSEKKEQALRCSHRDVDGTITSH